MNGCQYGSLTYKYATLLKNGRECADTLFCKLSWLQYAQPVIDDYIPVGTLISEPEVRACGLTNTIVGFAPPPTILYYEVVDFEYNGVPQVTGENATTITELMDAIISALTTLSGVQWSYTQTDTYEFLLCAPYTQNGDTVTLQIGAYYETLLGNLFMDVLLSGGVAPETPEYQTAAMNCISVTQYDAMTETSLWIKKGVKCCDIAKPTVEECVSENDGNGNIELREDNNIEEREGGN